MAENILYRKIGRKYVPVGEEFTGFPSDGVWYVQDGMRSMRHMMRIGDLPDPRPLVELEQYRPTVCDMLVQTMKTTESRGESVSVNEIVTLVFHALAIVSQANPKQRKESQ